MNESKTNQRGVSFGPFIKCAMNRYHRGYPRRTCKPAVASTSRRTNLDAAAMTCSMSSSRSRQRWRTSSSCASRAASASACSAARRADRACSSASSPRQRLSLSVRSATLCAAAGSSSCSSFQSRARSWRASSSRAERSCCEFEKRCQVRVSQRCQLLKFTLGNTNAPGPQSLISTFRLAVVA